MILEAAKLNRMQKQIQSDLSPKYTEMKTGVRTSRFGRPQKDAQKEMNSIPTEVAKFVSKHSPKRLKPKETNLEDVEGGDSKNFSTHDVLFEDKENFEKNDAPEPLTIKEEDHEVFVMIKQEDATVAEPAPIESKVLETCDEHIEVFKDVLRKAPSECSSMKQENFSDTDSALGNDMKKDYEVVAGDILWGSFSKFSWFPCMAYPINEEGTVVTGTAFLFRLLRIYLDNNFIL
jgi:hypothetical protein